MRVTFPVVLGHTAGTNVSSAGQGTGRLKPTHTRNFEIDRAATLPTTMAAAVRQ